MIEGTSIKGEPWPQSNCNFDSDAGTVASKRAAGSRAAGHERQPAQASEPALYPLTINEGET